MILRPLLPVNECQVTVTSSLPLSVTYCGRMHRQFLAEGYDASIKAT